MRSTSVRRRLRDCIGREEIAYLPGVHDALSAKLAAEHADADGLQHSGYGTAASLLGYPDLNFTSLKETVDVVRNAVRAAGDTPLVADADTGYGGVANVSHAITEIEQTGAAGAFIEDQAMPKQCGLLAGKSLVTVEEMVGKVRAAVDARTDDEFVVIARTDAYADHGVDEVVRRGNAYAEAGADVFLLGEVAPLDDLSEIAGRVDVPFYALAIETTNDAFETRHPIDAYDEAGVAVVSDVSGLLQVSVTAMQRYLDSMMRTGDHEMDTIPLDELSTFLGAEEYAAFEADHTP
ncbi:isocitrate lyase/PEP mutase family protein [Halorubrum sp. DTA46]|uniref:isocitrate lyase/PEP mutase family protein n=1 Tax=Halorubrum sp. DTA46 TaxID=3402162 RepID=UPI003AAD5486